MAEIDLDDIIRFETEVWTALTSGDAAADERLLADDFLGVYSSGFAGRSDHVQQLAGGPSVAAFELSDHRLTAVSSDSVMLSYRADYRRVATADASPWETMFVSSLWCRRSGRWVNTFSQDTAFAPDEPPP